MVIYQYTAVSLKVVKRVVESFSIDNFSVQETENGEFYQVRVQYQYSLVRAFLHKAVYVYMYDTQLHKCIYELVCLTYKF